MAKISPVSIKYMIHANLVAEGTLEKPDVIGALFGQTEGLLGSDLEMRDLQKEGKIGRIEVQLEKEGKRTIGKIQIPTALDQSETTLIAAAIETIERVGPSDAQIEVEKIEDVRGSKRDYILDRAKALMKTIEGSTDSREISHTIKTSARASEIIEYGKEKLPAGEAIETSKEIIVVEGRADVVNLLRNNIRNVIGMSGTKLPDTINELGKNKEITLFVDGDRGGKLIVQNVSENANVEYVAVAPDGKEVEELMGKEILMALRKKVPLDEFLKYNGNGNGKSNKSKSYEKQETAEARDLTEEDKEKLKELASKNSGKAIFLDSDLQEIKKVSTKAITGSLKRMRKTPFAIVMDGTANAAILKAAKDAGCFVVVAKNFNSVEEGMQLLSF